METVDTLSDVLRVIRLESAVYFRSDFAAPWGMTMDRSPYAQFHLVVRGSCWMQAEGMSRPRLLSAGDVLVFPFGDPHWLADDPAHEKRPGREVVAAIRRNGSPFAGDAPGATLVCGHFAFDRSVEHPFIEALPRMMLLERTSRHELTWLEHAAEVLIHEAGSGRPGSAVVVERLAEVLFIQTLRRHMASAKPPTGFLAALQDPRIAAVLRMMHHRPEAAWTLEALAREAGLSRSALATRFRTLVGMTPMTYLTAWRMLLARQMLRHSGLPLPAIAERVGYRSEAAFSRAFKRAYGKSPGRTRRAEA